MSPACGSVRNGHVPVPRSPFLKAPEAVPDDDHLGKGVYRPVAPQEVVVQGRPAVGHVKDGGLAPHAASSLLGAPHTQCKPLRSEHALSTRGEGGEDRAERSHHKVNKSV